MTRNFTADQLNLIENAKFGISIDIYDKTDMGYYAEQLNVPLQEMIQLVGLDQINEGVEFNKQRKLAIKRAAQEYRDKNNKIPSPRDLKNIEFIMGDKKIKVKNLTTDEIKETLGVNAINDEIKESHTMTTNNMRTNTQLILQGENKDKLFEALMGEGFLTEEFCNADVVTAMMEDDDICRDMYEYINESWLDTRAGANGKVFDGAVNEEDTIPKPEDVPQLEVPEEEPELEDVPDEGQPDDGVEPMVIHLSTEQIEELTNGGELALDGVIVKCECGTEEPTDEIPAELPGDGGDLEIAESEGDTREQLDNVTRMMAQYAKDYKMSPSEEIKNKLKDLTAKKVALTKALEDEVAGMSGVELNEGQMPNFDAKKGVNVDHDNAKHEKDYLDTRMKEIEGTQETTEEKVDNLKNQKYEMDKLEVDQVDAIRGQSPADGDVQGETPEYTDRVEREMATGDSIPSKEEKANVGDETVYTETPSGKDVSDDDNAGEGEVAKRKTRKDMDFYQSEPDKVDVVKESFDKMKHLMNFNVKETNKTKKLNDDDGFNKVYKRLMNK